MHFWKIRIYIMEPFNRAKLSPVSGKEYRCFPRQITHPVLFDYLCALIISNEII